MITDDTLLDLAARHGVVDLTPVESTATQGALVAADHSLKGNTVGLLRLLRQVEALARQRAAEPQA